MLNRLEYITAVIREVLRLQPPASTLRQGQKGYGNVNARFAERFGLTNVIEYFFGIQKPANQCQQSTSCYGPSMLASAVRKSIGATAMSSDPTDF